MSPARAISHHRVEDDEELVSDRGERELLRFARVA